MIWSQLSSFEKFIPLNVLFEKCGKPKFQLGTRPVYYMGNGFLISFSPKKFTVENNKRMEFGDPGEYALSWYFFMKKEELEAHFKLNHEKYDFEKQHLGKEFEILDGISLGSSYEQVSCQLRPQSSCVYYQEGETRSFLDGVFNFQNKFIAYDNYLFFFFGKSKKTKLSAFECVLK